MAPKFSIQRISSESGRSTDAGKKGQDGIPKPWFLRRIFPSSLLRLLLVHLRTIESSSALSHRCTHSDPKNTASASRIYATVISRKKLDRAHRRTGFQKVEHPATCSLICSYAIIHRAPYARVWSKKAFARKTGKRK